MMQYHAVMLYLSIPCNAFLSHQIRYSITQEVKNVVRKHVAKVLFVIKSNLKCDVHGSGTKERGGEKLPNMEIPN